jgi:cell division GTPase FtsZ
LKRAAEDVVRAVDKAVDIVAVGLGQAGGNLAAEFFRRGYRALAFNTATTDLRSLGLAEIRLPEELRFYIGLESYDGAGSDMAYGRECIRTHAAEIRDHVAAHTADADLLLVTAGFGGGTGSAVTELTQALAELSIPMVVLATLPTEFESGIAKVNAARALSELVKQRGIGSILIDNSRLAHQHGEVSYDRYYGRINRMIVEPIDAFNRLNSRADVSSIRSLDGEDYRTLLVSSGILNFSTATLTRLSGVAMMDALRGGLIASDIHVEGYHLEDVSYLAMVIEAPEHLLSDTAFSVFEQWSEHLKAETGGAGIYLGVYRTSAAQAHATVRLLASSQTLPDGVQEMVTQAKREGGQLQTKLQQVPSELALGEIEQFELFRTGPANARRRIVPAAASAATTPYKVPTSPMHSNTASSPQMPDRNIYDGLAKEFEHADSDEVKQRVSTRLEKDQTSSNSLVRYYAVRTMSKLGPRVFASALKAATHDEDATVRAVALKALNRA